MKKRFHNQRGSALVTVLGMIGLLAVLMAVSASVTIKGQRQTKQQFVREGQANNIARAGLQATLNWFKNQVAQPVKQDTLDPEQTCSIHKAFFPRENISQPENGDTLDEDVGLVKELKLQEPNIYGRYIIKRYDCTKPDNSPWNLAATRDVSFRRGKQDGNGLLGQGIVWQIKSEGVIYAKSDSSKEPDEAPNRVLQRATVGMEINRVALSVPKSPISLTAGSPASSFNNKCEVIGDPQTTHGIIRNIGTPAVSGSPTFSLPGGATTLHQINAGVGEVNKTVLNTFNMSVEELRASANTVYSSVSEISPTEPIPFGITFLEGNTGNTFIFNNTRPLKGSGILFVNGHLNLQNDSNSSFSGLLYVTGTLTVGSSNSIGGAVIAGRITCTPGTSSIIEYNDNVMTNVRQRLGLYSQNNLTLNVLR